MSPPADVLVAPRTRGLVTVTVNRARKHNALSRPVLAALAQAVAAAGRDAETRCVLLRGAGNRYFAAGGDLVDLAEVKTKPATRRMVDEATAALDAIRACPLPVVAFVNGDALGGGAELAVACDLRIAASHARLAYIHGRIGITSAWGGGTDLCELVGSAKAMRMMSRCEAVDAATALAWGLVDVIADDDAAIDAFIAPIVALPPLVLRGIKAQTRAWKDGLPREARRSVERDRRVETWLASDHLEAVERFLAGRRR